MPQVFTLVFKKSSYINYLNILIFEFVYKYRNGIQRIVTRRVAGCHCRPKSSGNRRYRRFYLILCTALHNLTKQQAAPVISLFENYQKSCENLLTNFKGLMKLQRVLFCTFLAYYGGATQLTFDNN